MDLDLIVNKVVAYAFDGKLNFHLNQFVSSANMMELLYFERPINKINMCIVIKIKFV